MTPLLSLIIAVYNKPAHLRMILAACSRQTFSDFEIIVADDGSDESVRNVVKEAELWYSFPILHIWHERQGWRKNAMLNKAIRGSNSSYLVFIDGDCIPHRKFLMDHWSEREEKKILCGRRVEMSERWTTKLMLADIKTGAFEKIGFAELWDGISGKAVRIEDGFHIRNRLIRALLRRKSRGILGSNFSVFKEDLEKINGFDESYCGPGCGEDSDIQYRLELIGVTCKSLRNKAIQYHLYHKKTEGSQDSILRLREVKRMGLSWCEEGLFKRDPLPIVSNRGAG